MNASSKLLIPLFLISFKTFINGSSQQELDYMYQTQCNTPSPIYEHIPVLKKLAQECSTVLEVGVYHMASTWGLLKGLADNGSSIKSYKGIDISAPPYEILSKAQALAKGNGITFSFLEANDMLIEIEPAEFLFIDSLHTYCHLTYELETFSPKISKYIVMHDTSAPWGDRDDDDYTGDYSEYPASIDRSKRGLWAAVEDFLSHHPEWKLVERRLNCHGLTILKRVF